MHVLDWQTKLDIHGLANTITKAHVISTGAAIEYEQHYVPSLKQVRTGFTLPPNPPGDLIPVICLETAEEQVLLYSLDSL
ncbi:MAG: hypothetical protein J7639_10600 [Paenibacillaceae bacterium]|nr:hypothetical protein [Paenibacillaceae bacterium]